MFKRLLSLSLAIIMCALLIGCSTESGPVSPAPADDEGGRTNLLNQSGQEAPLAVYTLDESVLGSAVMDPNYADVSNAFAAKMIYAFDKDGTGVFSPLSLQIALQVLANGGDDETMQDLLYALCPGMTREDVNASGAALIYSLLQSEGVTINNAVVANKAYGICTDFANTVADNYRATVGAIDFSDTDKALAQINKWVEDNTDGLVKDLLDYVAPNTAMVILNALTLKLDWKKPFTAMRGLEEFNGHNGLEYVAMIQTNDYVPYGSFEEGEAAVIPYVGDKYAMAVILPSEGHTPAEAAAAIIGKLDECRDTNIFLKMPKVDFDTKIDVLEIADKLGIEEGIKGNYTRLIEGDSATVTEVVQGAHLTVTESGTTAAAATAIVATKNGFAAPDAKIVCDRPYAMVIYHIETGAVLFVSIVNDAA